MGMIAHGLPAAGGVLVDQRCSTYGTLWWPVSLQSHLPAHARRRLGLCYAAWICSAPILAALFQLRTLCAPWPCLAGPGAPGA